MTNFLEKAAGYIFEQFSGDLGEVCIVLPNRRAGLFLKKYMSQLTDTPIFAPAVFSIEDFIFHLTALRKIEPAYLLFELYEIYRKIEGKNAGSFNEYLKWADVVIHDFNEVDLSLVNPDELFGFLSETKAISLWNPDDQPLTDFEVRYLKFFNSLSELYMHFRDALLNRKVAYQGLAYRTCAEQVQDGQVPLEWKKLFFVGFNALTKAEKVIIKILEESGKATLLWDADPYYLNDPVQEAGTFLRENQKYFASQELTWTEEHFKDSRKNIYLIGVPKKTGQAKVAGDLLDKIQKQTPDLDKTSIVLNDESLLAPLLNSLPEDVKAFNLTMGLPLRNTVLFGLINGFIQLNENALRFDKSKGKNLRYYYKDLLRIIDHPYFFSLFSEENTVDQSPAIEINTGNQVFYSLEEFGELFSERKAEHQESIRILFKPWGNSSLNAADGILFLLKKLKFAFSSETSQPQEIDIEYIFHFSKLFNTLKNSIQVYPFLNELESLRKIFGMMVRSITIPFYGEPLKGVQVMGMLETRTLDFDTIIMLSVNEDFIPGGSTVNSFIPFEIRRNFNLPTHRERNAVSAYHFYRLLQRANTIYLLFNTEAGDMGGGDRSRFISQIENELKKYNPFITFHKSILSIAPDEPGSEGYITINKSSDILETLRIHARKGFSASAVNTYRNCSLQFYFRHILGIDESEEVEETIEASTLGTVVHEVLFIFYQRFKGKQVVADDLNQLKPDIEKAIQTAFEKNYSKGDVKHGKNFLITKVAESFVLRFIQSEVKSIKEAEKFNSSLMIKDLEVGLEADHISEKPGRGVIKLKGFIDRVDVLGRTVRIIDYKTGRVEQSELKLKDWEDLIIPGKYDKVFQLLFYANLYLLQKNSGETDPEVGIFSFKNLRQGLLLPSFPGEVTIKNASKHFREILDLLFDEMFDEKMPFQQTEELKVCKYCSFNTVCNR